MKSCSPLAGWEMGTAELSMIKSGKNGQSDVPLSGSGLIWPEGFYYL
jgi:hypothetical protein